MLLLTPSEQNRYKHPAPSRGLVSVGRMVRVLHGGLVDGQTDGQTKRWMNDYRPYLPGTGT